MQALFVLLCTKLTILLQQAMEILVYIIVLHLHLHLYVCLHQKEGDKEIPLMLHAIPINTIHHHILQDLLYRPFIHLKLLHLKSPRLWHQRLANRCYLHRRFHTAQLPVKILRPIVLQERHASVCCQ